MLGEVNHFCRFPRIPEKGKSTFFAKVESDTKLHPPTSLMIQKPNFSCEVTYHVLLPSLLKSGPGALLTQIINLFKEFMKRKEVTGGKKFRKTRRNRK